jgi:hypothetical protein
LVAGSAIIGRVGIDQTTPGVTNRVDVGTMPTISITSNSAVNMAQVGGVNVTRGNGVSGTGVLRVTIASDSTGQVKLAEGTAAIGSITNTSFATTQSGTWTVGLSAEQTLATVTTVGTVTSITNPVAVTNADITSIKTAVELLDNTVNVHDDVALTSMNMVGGKASTTAPTAVAVGDAVQLWLSTSGAVNLAATGINLVGGVGTSSTAALRVVEASAATGTQTNPSLSTTSATLLAASTSRRGATVYNGSTSIVYVRLSATAASSTTFTVKLYPEDYYEVPGNYNGAITAVLNTGTTTSVQVTQVT